MAKSIHQPKIRKIITEFAEAIDQRKQRVDKETQLIPFRNDQIQRKRRNVYLVPLDLLYFRKDNGRIASDVLTYEVIYGTFDETTDTGQLKLKEFLASKDKEKTAELINALKLNKQTEPAVISADGFLINGNRRKLAFLTLLQEDPSNEEWKYLKVVILPGPQDPEAPPTENEIEQLENRYQFQLLGKAEYYNFDKALSIRRKIEHGMSLEEQLKDDPNYANLTPAKFDQALQKFKEEYLEPLDCIDRYLAYFKKTGRYNLISSGLSDREGRWQAFLDYYKSVYKKLLDPKQRIQLGVEEDEVGLIENAAFDIIRKREVKDIDKKVHQVMREFPKLLQNESAKRNILELGQSTKSQLTDKESKDQYGKRKSEDDLDYLWEKQFGEEINYYVKQAYRFYQNKKLEDAPIQLLQEALKNLNDETLKASNVSKTKITDAIEYLDKIAIRANDLKKEFTKTKMTKKRRSK